MSHIAIIGTRGVPANHGGFETFAEQLSLYLVERGWQVTVYCHEVGPGPVREDFWNGVHRVTIPIRVGGAFGTILFDFLTIVDVLGRGYRSLLSLGYNTAVFALIPRLFGIRNAINMDGIEWKRAKWNRLEKIWLWLNERAGCHLGNRLIADHPEIARHLATRVNPKKIATIAYGAFPVEQADPSIVEGLGLGAGRYAVVIARPEPENSVLEIVRAFSNRERGMRLAVLGNYDSDKNPYHFAVKKAASHEVVFLGAIYDRKIVDALRLHAYFYIHGHQVGGTNPSLVEALGASCAVLAHDNPFNRWVAADGALYFRNEAGCDDALNALFERPELVGRLKQQGRLRYAQEFTWDRILQAYEQLLVSLQ